MDSLLVGLKAVVDGLGATVLLPIVIFVIALVFGAKPGRAFRAAVTIGVAFIGINLVIGLMWTSLSDVSQAIVTNTGIKRDIVDVGWPSAAAIAFGSSVGLWVIPVAIAVNIALLFAGMTRTLNVDVWNFWHFAFIGSLVVAATNSLTMGIIAAALMAALALLFGDWSAKAVQRFYGVPGISIPHLASGQILPIAIAVNWVIERIPGLRDINLDTDTVQRRFGVAGEPVVLGLIIGVVLGLLGYWNMASTAAMVTKVLQTGMTLAAVMLLLPRMVKILMEGLIPVAEAAREFVQKRAGHREINIGLDSAILIGHPAAISSALILVPIAISALGGAARQPRASVCRSRGHSVRGLSYRADHQRQRAAHGDHRHGDAGDRILRRHGALAAVHLRRDGGRLQDAAKRHPDHQHRRRFYVALFCRRRAGAVPGLPRPRRPAGGHPRGDLAVLA